jgi:molecular chaperone HtpG
MAEQELKSYKFKAEIKQLLDILVHSLYTNREVFVRELVSNAADALDKVRFEEVRGTDLLDKNLLYEINIDLDKKKNVFTITDTGIGMTSDELIKNIGTIAHSGTTEFLKKMQESNQEGPKLIGQFGVGFYSVFMAGKEVVVTTHSYLPDSPPCEWRSDGEGSYQIKEIESAPRGTKIEVFLRDDVTEFADENRIEEVIKKYSNFVPFPIKINGRQINTISAIWREPKASVKPEQYTEFFKFIANSTDEPLSHLHLSADVPIQFNSLLFIPKTNYEVYGFMPREIGVNLFVKRILVQSHCKEILPQYLRFLRGVVDSEDIPLNISRETLQENTEIAKIKSVLVKKVLAHLSELAEQDAEKYNSFWKEFSNVFKEGYSDYANQEKIAELCRFNSSLHKTADELTSLQDYINRMPGEQKDIYYLSSSSREAIERNPHLEMFKDRGLEVLFLFEPIDEFLMTGIREFKGKKLVSADQVEPSSIKSIKPKVEKEKPEKKDIRELGDLCARMKNILGDKVTEVRPSERLTDSPAVLINPDGTMSTQMQKIMQTMNRDVKLPPKVMEINGDHPLITNFFKIYQKNPKDEYLAKAVTNLFYSIMLLDGYVPDPHDMVNSVQELLLDSSNLQTEKL